jgi:hypothetical protein
VKVDISKNLLDIPVVFPYNIFVASAGRRFRRKTLTVRLKAHRNREAG